MPRLFLLLPLLLAGCGGTPSPTAPVLSPPVPNQPVVAPVPVVQPASGGDWPLFRGGPLATGTRDVPLPDPLTERWTFRCKDSVDGAPAVVGGVVYVASTDKHLYAVDLATGREKWKTKLGKSSIMKCSPAVRGGVVYVGDLSGTIYAVAADTGDVKWAYTPEATGEIVSGCSFHGDNVLAAAQGMPVVCVNPKGEKVWEFEIDGGSNGCPTVNGDTVYASGCDSKFHAIDAKTGKEEWGIDIGGQAAATIAVDGGFAYLGTVTRQVLAIDLTARKVAWTFEPKDKAQEFYSSAAVTPELVILGSRDSRLYALDRKTGEERWSFVTEGMVDPSPVVSGGKVYVGCLSVTAEFYVLDAKTGKKVEELSLKGASGSASVGPDCLVVGTEKGWVYCWGNK